jgi:hypothetical protein
MIFFVPVPWIPTRQWAVGKSSTRERTVPTVRGERKELGGEVAGEPCRRYQAMMMRPRPDPLRYSSSPMSIPAIS